MGLAAAVVDQRGLNTLARFVDGVADAFQGALLLAHVNTEAVAVTECETDRAGAQRLGFVGDALGGDAVGAGLVVDHDIVGSG